MEYERYDKKKHGKPVSERGGRKSEGIDEFWADVLTHGGVVINLGQESLRTIRSRLDTQARVRDLRMSSKKLPDGRYLITAVPR